jgi:hypothetical protein
MNNHRVAKNIMKNEELSYEGEGSHEGAFTGKEMIFRTKRSYVPVEFDKRQCLIKAVEEEGLTIKEAA